MGRHFQDDSGSQRACVTTLPAGSSFRCTQSPESSAGHQAQRRPSVALTCAQDREMADQVVELGSLRTPGAVQIWGGETAWAREGVPGPPLGHQNKGNALLPLPRPPASGRA